MAGYNWRAGKSNRAVAAEAEGKMTATAFAKWVRKWRRYRGCTAADVAQDAAEAAAAATAAAGAARAAQADLIREIAGNPWRGKEA